MELIRSTMLSKRPTVYLNSEAYAGKTFTVALVLNGIDDSEALEPMPRCNVLNCQSACGVARFSTPPLLHCVGICVWVVNNTMQLLDNSLL